MISATKWYRSDFALGIEIKLPKKHRDQFSLSLGFILWTFNWCVYNIAKASKD